MKSCFIYLSFLTLLFVSCKKDTDPVNNSTDNVSGNLKRIILNPTGIRAASIVTLDYDASGRVVNFKYWEEDSTTTPISITYADYIKFHYSGTDEKPVKSSLTTNTSTVPDTTYYTYAQNRVIKEEEFRNGNLTARNTYTYLTGAIARTTEWGTPFIARRKDTSFVDGSNNVIKLNSYGIPLITPQATTFAYDSKKNPIGLTNIGRYVRTFFVDDIERSELSVNNLTNATGNYLDPSDNIVQTATYEYSSNDYPLKATRTQLHTSTSVVQTATIRFEYY